LIGYAKKDSLLVHVFEGKKRDCRAIVLVALALGYTNLGLILLESIPIFNSEIRLVLVERELEGLSGLKRRW